ncbi:unnamed protein product [Urochloa decumbens]|uniref:Uncharacterized protein n=1 Tax=Urochloa decumbens TaxID=240449 RepID=A0ABC9AZM2_9POAL
MQPEQLDELDPQLRLWASEVRDASYNMEDIVDTYLVEVAAPADEKNDGLVKRLQKNIADLFKKSKARHTIAGAIENMKKRLQELHDRRKRFSVPVARPAQATKPDPRLAYMHKEAAQLIGIDKTKAELVGMFLASSNGNGDADVSVSSGKMKIVSVVGGGGLGKTTLAKAVYKELEPQYMITLNGLSTLGTDLYFHVARYFIVIDDVWDVPIWQTIKSVLVENDSASRVITTTRNREVASEEEVYELNELPPNDSKRLFYVRLFGGEGKCPANHPHEASEKILNKCGGVPLAIITMASLLVGKSIEDWFDVCNSPGFYREDYLIEKKSLIWKWIAEGFVQTKTGTGLYQRGEEYFNELINRNMIQAVESTDEAIHCCLIHDMVLDLICGLSDKEKFVNISLDDDRGTSSLPNKVRRLAQQNKITLQTQQDHHMGMAQLRSLVACRCGIESWVLQPSFKLLHLLALERCRVSGHKGWQGLQHLGKLLHLRYLGLRGIYGRFELPEKIGELKFLQTLDLDYCVKGVLPSGVCQLTQLLCLRGGHDTYAPDGLLRKMTSLEELNIRIDNLNDESQRQFMRDLGNQSEVRELYIIGSLKQIVQQSLGNLHKLRHLDLVDHNGEGEAATREWDTVVLPQHLQSLGLYRFYTFLSAAIMD